MIITDEYGEKHTLEIVDKNGIDWTVDFVGGFFDTDENDEYVGKKLDIQWWQDEINAGYQIDYLLRFCIRYMEVSNNVN
jgi:hypothetical protein